MYPGRNTAFRCCNSIMDHVVHTNIFKTPANFWLKSGSFPAFFIKRHTLFKPKSYVTHEILASLQPQKYFKNYYIPAAHMWREAQTGNNWDQFLKMLFNQKILYMVNIHPWLMTALSSTYLFTYLFILGFTNIQKISKQNHKRPQKVV